MAEIYLVEFKGSRKEFFYNTYYHSLKPSEYVILQAERGEDIGLLSKKVDIEMEFEESQKPRSILRRASDEDMSRYEAIKEKEIAHKEEVVGMIADHKLQMKVVDVEWQFDSNKMTIFFTADHRVDFRELVKTLASRYKTRIELRQIGVRDEARRLGGIGICGLQQCCNTFLVDFQPISTQHARDQDLPLNPSKISGNCGRLLCCLRYEIDTYEEIKKKFPKPGMKVDTKNGTGVIERVDIFNEQIVLRDEEGIFVRASAEEIKRVHTEDGPQKFTRSVLEELDEKDLSEDEIRKLDDSN